ncbi:MAG TPA: rhomboid family intramembrane serine protease [Candidatus Manganitrophaceae bacterium]|nr:rhomboid family intramembrane serine protease [Candidatus Manganitrophaceae bacterium]
MIPIRDTIPSRTAPVMTWMLIAVNSAVFLYETSLDPATQERLFYLFGLVPARYSHPDWALRLGLPPGGYSSFLTCMFLHGGWIHLIGNMWTLWIFGDNVEELMGPARFLFFYLLTGVISGITHFYTNIDSPVPTVGASGAIAGVLGAYFVLFPHSRIIVLFPIFLFPFFFEVPAGVYLLFWAATQLLSGTVAGVAGERVAGVAWWAHVGGFASGMVLYRFFLIRGRGRPRRLEQDELGVEGAWTRSYQSR